MDTVKRGVKNAALLLLVLFFVYVLYNDPAMLATVAANVWNFVWDLVIHIWASLSAFFGGILGHI